MKNHYNDTLRWVETEPYVWRLYGCFPTPSILHDFSGCNVLVQAESRKNENESYPGIIIKNGEEPYWSERTPVRVRSIQIDLPPFFSVKCYFPFSYGIVRPPEIDYKEVNGKIVFTFEATSSNPICRLIQMFAEHYNLTVKHERKTMTIPVRAMTDSAVRFLHRIHSWGYGNTCYLEYRFDDLLNMDCSLFSARSLNLLENECKRYDLISKSLDMNVFKRPLTDREKVRSTELFFNIFQREAKKHTISKNYNYATS